jgi:hypothetical protein
VCIHAFFAPVCLLVSVCLWSELSMGLKQGWGSNPSLCVLHEEGCDLSVQRCCVQKELEMRVQHSAQAE